MKTLNDHLTEINEVAADTALRVTKDSGERDVNEATGFKRDTQNGKFKFSDEGMNIINMFLDAQDVDSLDALVTDYDPDGVGADYLVHDLFINRTAAVLARGAKKYGEHNWQRGNNLSRSFDSLFRHIMQWYLGDTSEDHLAAAACNLMFLMVHEATLHRDGNFYDEHGNSLGKHKEFADAGALFWEDVRYNMPNGSSSTLGEDDILSKLGVGLSGLQQALVDNWRDEHGSVG